MEVSIDVIQQRAGVEIGAAYTVTFQIEVIDLCKNPSLFTTIDPQSCPTTASFY